MGGRVLKFVLHKVEIAREKHEVHHRDVTFEEANLGGPDPRLGTGLEIKIGKGKGGAPALRAEEQSEGPSVQSLGEGDLFDIVKLVQVVRHNGGDTIATDVPFVHVAIAVVGHMSQGEGAGGAAKVFVFIIMEVGVLYTSDVILGGQCVNITGFCRTSGGGVVGPQTSTVVCRSRIARNLGHDKNGYKTIKNQK